MVNLIQIQGLVLGNALIWGEESEEGFLRKHQADLPSETDFVTLPWPLLTGQPQEKGVM